MDAGQRALHPRMAKAAAIVEDDPRLQPHHSECADVPKCSGQRRSVRGCAFLVTA